MCVEEDLWGMMIVQGQQKVMASPQAATTAVVTKTTEKQKRISLMSARKSAAVGVT